VLSHVRGGCAWGQRTGVSLVAGVLFMTRVNASRTRWTLLRDGAVVYDATDEHVALATRTMGVDETTWRRLVDGYAEHWHAGADVGARLLALRTSWEACTPRVSPPEPGAGLTCPCCGGEVNGWLARQPLRVGRCSRCGHGLLVEGGSREAVYATASYFERVDLQTSAGYAQYEKEQNYREAKGAKLLDWIEARCGPRKQRLLEVGSGYGYTRKSAEARGMQTTGVDINPHASGHAKQLYGMDTHTGDLASALACGAVQPGQHDLVLYQFVLEHVRDPCAELAMAGTALAPGGVIALVVPSAEAAEIEVFGAAYRSIRGDHLHLFTRRSIEAVLARVGLAVTAFTTECNIHLLLGFLTAEELEQDIYAAGRGPDMMVIARAKQEPRA
jgi:SAM-dependent methyltransferase